MSMNRVVRNGRVIDPASGRDEVCDIFISEPIIAGVGNAPAGFEANAADVDASGKLVMPGIVDLAARMREPGQEHKATIASESRAAAASGITTVCHHPDTQPVIDAPAEVELLRRLAKRAGHTWIVPIGALTRGLKGEHLSELAALKEAGCPAVSNSEKPITDTRVLYRCLAYAATFDLPVIVEPTDAWLGKTGCAHDGVIAARLGLPGIPEAAETSEMARVIALAEAVGARVHFGRISTGAGADLIRRARQRGVRVSGDVCAHQLFLTEHDLQSFDSNFHVNPPLRTTSDRDALRYAVADGTIGAICSDHQPHDFDAKDNPFIETEPGISAFETLLPLTLRLVEEGVVDLPTAVTRLTAGPAGLLGIAAGSLSIGARADLCIVDLESPWRVDPDAFLSAGKNSPFKNWEFRARVMHTIYEGISVFESESRP